MTQEECEAIIAHELAHAEGHDLWVKSVLMSLRAFFWWIPGSSLQKRLELQQEYACDRKALRMGAQPLALAQAIQKAAAYHHRSRQARLPTLAIPFLYKKAAFKRLHRLLCPARQESMALFFLKSCLAFIGMISVLFGEFWTF